MRLLPSLMTIFKAAAGTILTPRTLLFRLRGFRAAKGGLNFDSSICAPSLTDAFLALTMLIIEDSVQHRR